jgi:hypothetical protein
MKEKRGGMEDRGKMAVNIPQVFHPHCGFSMSFT